MRRRTCWGLLVVAWWTTGPLVVSGADWYVATNGNGVAGTNWGTAFTNVQTALAAATNSDTIYLAGHLFSLTNQLDWVNNTNVTIRGGYAATNDADQPGPYDSRRWPTILARVGATDFRIMSITNVATGLLERVAFTGGRESQNSQPSGTSGGGLYILNSTNLIISTCSITNNAAFQPGANWYSYGGGIYSESSVVTVSNCLIRGNSAIVQAGGYSYGGGIYIKNGALLLQDSILGNNLADSTYTYAHFGGGLYNNGGSCVLRNCLVVGNAAGSVGYQPCSAGGLHAKGNTRLENCTVTDNAGVGIYQESGTVTVTNSIVWGNVDDLAGAVTLGWSNIEDGDQNGTNGNISANPLFEYGYYLATNSPCVDAGTNTADAWGLTNATTRADGSNDSARVDLGYHYATGMDLTIADLYVAVNGANTNSGTNWAQAFQTIGHALAVAQDGTRIHLASGNYTNGSETFPLWVAERNGLKILGTNRTTTVINAAGATQQVMVVTNCAGLTMAEVTLTGGSRTMLSVSYGGGVFLKACGGVELSGCVIANNSLQGNGANVNIYGGGIYSMASAITLSNCLIKGNTAFTPSGTSYAYGGGIFLKGGSMMARDSIIANNVALRTESGRQSGGGIYSDGGSCVLRNCLMVGNSVGAAGTGAGLSQAGNYSVMRIENCTVADNSGQGLYTSDGTVAATNSIFWGNGDDLASAVTMAYSDIQTADGFWTNGVNGNLSSDPLFDRGYYLATNSPCVDAGTNDASFWNLSELTTRADGTNDSGRVNLGYHYATGLDMTYADVYVATNGTNTNGGTSWADAFRTITKALTVARDGTRIHVGAGYYTNGWETFPLTVAQLNGVQILGTNRAATVIDAAGANQRVMTVSNCANLTVSEITFAGGYLTQAAGNPIYGGGLFLAGCGGLVMSGCVITNNSIRYTDPNGWIYGGGIYSSYSGLTLSNCLVTSNSVISVGSYAASGGGIYQSAGSLNLLNSILASNTAIRNTTLGMGGGIYNDAGSCALRNCLVAGNLVGASGGGGGLYLNGNTSLENCTVVNNTNQGINRANGTVAVTNSILWGNGDDITGTVVMAFSDVQTGDAFWTNGVNGNIMTDPIFVNTNAADYRLAKSSLCRDVGTNLGWMTGAVDLDGLPRIQGGRVDMGAYEGVPRPGGTIFTIH